MTRAIRLLTGAVTLGLCMAGPLAVAQTSPVTIALLTKNQTNPFFFAERLGAEDAAKSMGAKLLEYIPTQPDSIPEQMSEIDDVIQRKPDAIVIVPVDYKAMVPGIDKINAAGIPVVNITDRSAGGKFVSFVGANDYDIAKATGLKLMTAMGGKGTVIILQGVPARTPARTACAASRTRSPNIPASSSSLPSRPIISACRRWR